MSPRASASREVPRWASRDGVAASDLIATTNSGKVREFRQLLSGLGIRFHRSLRTLELAVIEETGTTFAENAASKPADTQKNYLNGRWPTTAGWRSMPSAASRACTALGRDEQRRPWRRRQQRAAAADNSPRFPMQNDPPALSALALSDPSGKIVLTASDTIERNNSPAQSTGGGGFGYDPLFLVAGLKTKPPANCRRKKERRSASPAKSLRKLATLMQSSALFS